jgi:hypothetical protein
MQRPERDGGKPCFGEGTTVEIKLALELASTS